MKIQPIVSDLFTSMTWEQALALPARLNAEKHKGYADWRLPTVTELMGKINRETGEIAEGYSRGDGCLWSSSLAHDASFAWSVGFSHGYVIVVNKDDFSSARCVRP